MYSQEHKFIFTSQVLKRMFISRHKWVTGILLLLVLLIIYRVSLFFSRKIRFEAAQSTDMTDTLHTRAQYQVIDINLHTCINMGLLTIWSIIPSSHCIFTLRYKVDKNRHSSCSNKIVSMSYLYLAYMDTYFGQPVGLLWSWVQILRLLCISSTIWEFAS